MSGPEPIAEVNWPADAWGPMPIRWRHVRPEDIAIISGRAWMITAAETFGRTTRIAGLCGPQRHSGEVDPDATITVLVPLAEREAIRVARDALGGTVHDRQ